MATDIALLKHALGVLTDLAGNALHEDALIAEIEIRGGRPLVTQSVRATLIFARDKGWAAMAEDFFGRDTWKITDAGKAQYRQM
jgi:hypothetical protein